MTVSLHLLSLCPAVVVSEHLALNDFALYTKRTRWYLRGGMTVEYIRDYDYCLACERVTNITIVWG